MTEYTEEEINDMIEKVFTDYITHYQADKMTFREFAIIENILLKLQNEMRLLNDKKESEA